MNRRDFTLLGILLPLRSAALAFPADDRRIAPAQPGGAPGPATTMQPVARTGARHALVMGNIGYRKAGTLLNCINDVNAVAGLLKSLHFNVSVCTDFVRSQGDAALRSFVGRLLPGDVAVLFYSGHGVQVGGFNYMVPIEYDGATGEGGVAKGCLSVAEAQNRIEKTGVRLNVIIIDACRDNPFRRDGVKGLALMEAGLGTCIALAAAPGQTASDNPSGKNGLFTESLLKQFQVSGQTLESAFRAVKEEVYAASGGKQRPWLLFDTIGEYTFAGDPVPLQDFDRSIATGRQHFETGDLEQAATSFERARRLRPADPYVYNALGATRLRMKRLSDAVELFSKAIALKDDYTAAYYNRAIAYVSSGHHHDQAIQDLTWAVDADPLDPRPVTMRGQTYLAMLDDKHALEDFDQALTLNPADAAALLGRGRVMFRRGNKESALQDLTLAIAIRPTADAYRQRAAVWRQLQDSAKASADESAAAQAPSK